MSVQGCATVQVYKRLGVQIRAVTNNQFKSIQVANRLIDSKLSESIH